MGETKLSHSWLCGHWFICWLFWNSSTLLSGHIHKKEALVLHMKLYAIYHNDRPGGTGWD